MRDGAVRPRSDSVRAAMATSEIDRVIHERLADRDLRYTAGRRAIVDALATATGPITLPELLRAAPALAQSSAYRNLAVMEEAGVVRRVAHGGDHTLYELAESLTEHHHHLICESCGVVLDVAPDDELERSLHRSFGRVAAREGFTPSHHTVDVYGCCADCAA